jgi:hypothetical protein
MDQVLFMPRTNSMFFADIDRIIRSVIDNNYVISNKLSKEFSLILNSEFADNIFNIVSGCFKK